MSLQIVAGGSGGRKINIYILGVIEEIHEIS